MRKHFPTYNISILVVFGMARRRPEVALNVIQRCGIVKA
jgi:hypothetical protein